MNVVLVHPVHGAKVAINEVEMRSDMANGWTPLEDAPDRVPEDPETPKEIPDFLTPSPKKRGRRRAT